MSHNHKYLLVLFFLNAKIKSTLPPIYLQVHGYRRIIDDRAMDISTVLLFAEFL